jgi:phospholipase/lecithinase/hemolysin
VDSCEPIIFDSVIAFGDGLSDVGTYTPYTSIARDGSSPYYGGKFTTNSRSSTTWVENIASNLGLTITPAFHVDSQFEVACPTNSSCTGYAQGGARVSDPDGTPISVVHSETSMMPVSTQIATHLARSNNTFTSTDLVFIWAGMSDVIFQMLNLTKVEFSILEAYFAHNLTRSQAMDMYYDAVAFAREEVSRVATQLGMYVVDSIVGNGASYVVVIGLFDLSVSPFGIALNQSSALESLSVVFNERLVAELHPRGTNGSRIQFLDPTGLFKSLSNLGFSNIDTPACDASRISEFVGAPMTNAWSLLCNTDEPYNDLVDSASALSWFWADDIHVTTGGHRLLSEALWQQMHTNFRWIV